MPPFMTLPPQMQPRRGFTRGLPAYSAGSFPVGQAPAKFYVQNVTASGSTVTLGVRQIEGNIPAVGQLVTVTGTVVAGSLANVTNVALSAVSITAATGIGTISYASAAPAIAQTNDGGMAIANVSDVGEPNAIQKWQQFALDPSGGELITLVWGTPSAPATISLQLEGAVDDVDAQYAIIGTAQTTLNGSVVLQVPNG
ncbi:MAG TPA: hypothetical protein VF760_02120, partial [Xanthobacteraceae bacterium]